MHSALTGVQVLVTRTQEHAHWLGFIYCDGRERESDRNIIFRCSFIGYFFPRVSYCDNKDVWLQNRKIEHQNTLQSDQKWIQEIKWITIYYLCKKDRWWHFNFLNYLVNLHEFKISTSRIQDFYFTNSRFQLHEFTISASRIHDFNFMNSRIDNFNFRNSRFQLHEYYLWFQLTISTS
jgi:hypothetical protein